MPNRDCWDLYQEVKSLVQEANQIQEAHNTQEISQLEEELRQLLREYARLSPSLPNLCFSRLLFQTLRFPKEVEFLPKLMKWAGLNSFQEEDYKAQSGDAVDLSFSPYGRVIPCGNCTF